MGTELTTWEHGVFERFIEVCLDGDETAKAQLDHVVAVEREASRESGVYVRIEIDRAAAKPLGVTDGSPYTLHADDEDGPFVELLIWLNDGYLRSIEGWKQQMHDGQADAIVALPNPAAFEAVTVHRVS